VDSGAESGTAGLSRLAEVLRGEVLRGEVLRGEVHRFVTMARQA
jgi:hypothetical protein